MLFVNNTTLSGFYLFFLIIDFAGIIKIFNPSAKLAIPISVPYNKAKAKIERKLVIVDTKISKNYVQ